MDLEERIMKFIDPEARYSDAVIAGNVVYLSGQVPEDEHADITAQTESVLRQIEALLERCGTDKGHILEATVYLRDMADLAAMNAVWDAWTVEGRAPARACVQALLANPNWRVEIKLSACLPFDARKWRSKLSLLNAPQIRNGLQLKPSKPTHD